MPMVGIAFQSTLLGSECTTIHAGLDSKAAEIVDVPGYDGTSNPVVVVKPPGAQ